MNRQRWLILLTVLLLALSACSRQEEISLLYGETFQADKAEFDQYASVEWESFDPDVAAVRDGLIEAVGPGTTTVTAKADGKTIADYLIDVTTIAIDRIELSMPYCQLVEDTDTQLKFTVYPENASLYGLKWESDDPQIATVDASGTVLALQAGQTTVTLSDNSGIIEKCIIDVQPKSAYERLSDEERAFVDLALKHLDSFKNPASVIIKAIEPGSSGDTWKVKVSAQNGFGGNSTEIYSLDDSLGFWNWETLGSALDVDLNIEMELEPDESYNIALINDAIQEKQ